MKWTEEKTGRGWGVKGVAENGREREQGPQAIDGKRGEGWNEQACRREGGLCGLRLS